MKNPIIKKILFASFVAALYIVLTITFSFSSFGVIQIRVSEALVLLCVLFPEAIIGVTIGCLISNFMFSTPIDVLFGTIATLIAAILTYLLRNYRFKGLPILASLPPVIVNAIIIGPMITYYFIGTTDINVMLFNIATVAIGQAVSCCLLGVLLVRTIEKNKTLLKYFKSN